MVKLWLGSIYGPVKDKDKDEFYKSKLLEAGSEISKMASSKDMIWIGIDANSVMNEELDLVMIGGTEEDKKQKQNKVRKNGEPFRAWADWMDLQDIWRDRNESKKKYTRVSWEDKEDNIGEHGRVSNRIDYIMTNELMAQMIKQTGIVPTSHFTWSSDHKVTWTEVTGLEKSKANTEKTKKETNI